VGEEELRGICEHHGDSPDLVQAESTLIGAAATDALTSKELARAAELSGTNGISEREKEQATSEAQTAEGALKAARDAVRVFGKTEAEIDQINASMDRMKRQAIDIKANITSTEDAERAHRNAMRTFESQQAAQGANIRNAQQEVKNLLADIDAAETAAAANPITLQIAQRTERAAALDAELAGHQERKNKAQAGLRHMDYWRQGFKRVKLFLIKRALDVLQIETAAAAGQLGLIDWTITYVTETETKSGTLKAGVQILVKAPQAPGAFSLQSGGEGQRVRLAISIGLSNMIQRMAGVDYRIEIWDEPSAWLSPEGIADLMECLHERAEDTGKQLWVIDHRVYDSTTFNAAYIMVKTDAGSHLEQLA